MRWYGIIFYLLRAIEREFIAAGKEHSE